MNKKLNIFFLFGLSTLLIFCACAAPVISVNADNIYDETIFSINEQYRASNLVISGVCVDEHINANNEQCFDVLVKEVFAGNANVNDVLHCGDYFMHKGEEYVLFLEQGEDVHHSEDMPSFDLLTKTPISLKDGVLSFDNASLDIELFRNELEVLNSVINAPIPIYFYEDLKALTLEADEIFIGTVLKAPKLQEYDFALRNGGSIEKIQSNAAIIEIEAYGSIKGVTNYGDILNMVYNPLLITGMLDSKTLKPVSIEENNALSLNENGIYLFFLIYGPDAKQNYMFPVNAIQGFIEISGERVRSNTLNTPMRNYKELASLIVDIRKSVAESNIKEENPGLIVIEE